MPLFLVSLYLGISAMLTFLHAYNVNMVPGYSRLRRERHMEIVEGRGMAPYGYRVVVPRLIEPVRKGLLALEFTPLTAREAPYLLVRFVLTFLALVLFHRFMGAWFDEPWCVVGTLLFAVLHPATYYHYWYQPASSLDLVLWLAAALSATQSKSPWRLLPLVLLGAFNRETIVFAPLLYGALVIGRVSMKRLFSAMAAGLLIWGIVFLSLRLCLVGPLPRVVTLSEVVRENLDHPWWMAYAVVFMGVLWILPILNWRRMGPELKRITLVMFPYLLLQLLFGRIREVRLLLPVSMLLIPLAVDRLKAVLEPTAPLPTPPHPDGFG